MGITSFTLDPEKSAKKAGLRYITDAVPGFCRIKRGNRFLYLDKNKKPVKDEKILKRIRALVIPPAWQNVWISPLENGHLQATGIDVKNRKQYLYHPDWHNHRNQTKFYRLSDFSKWLPQIRMRLERDLSSKIIDREKIIATVIAIMEKSSMRIGNNEYAVTNHSFGITTLRDRHVQVEGTKMRFEFKGKKGIVHKVELQDRRLARIVQHCRDIPGYELFQYYDENGHKQHIDSGDVNAYLQEITGEDFSAKDFRTWAGTLHAFRVLREICPANGETERKKQVVEAVKEVSRKLGNTPAVCRKYYIHPLLLTSFEDGKLIKFIKAYRKKDTNEDEDLYDGKMLLKFLERQKK